MYEVVTAVKMLAVRLALILTFFTFLEHPLLKRLWNQFPYARSAEGQPHCSRCPFCIRPSPFKPAIWRHDDAPALPQGAPVSGLSCCLDPSVVVYALCAMRVAPARCACDKAVVGLLDMQGLSAGGDVVRAHRRPWARGKGMHGKLREIGLGFAVLR